MRVEIEAEHPVGAGRLDEIGHELGADGHTRLILAVLACVPGVGEHGGHAGGRGATGGIDEEQQLQHVLARRVGGLHDEDVGAADVLVDPHEHFTVGEARAGHLAQFRAHRAGHLLRQRPVGGAGENLESAGIGRGQDVRSGVHVILAREEGVFRTGTNGSQRNECRSTRSLAK